jgi:hypothetical protein
MATAGDALPAQTAEIRAPALLLTLSSDLAAHMLDFGTDVIQAHSAPSLPSGLCGQALPPCALAGRRDEAA